jgi:3-dehydroquinate dehydratase-1
MVKEAKAAGATIVKLATTARSRGDVTRLLRFTENANVPMVAIAMGPVGTISRVVAPLFGSLFTYAFIGEEVAPGQMSLDEMVLPLRRLYPGMVQDRG